MDDWERFSEGGGLLDLPAPLVSVDTFAPLDVTRLAAEVTTALANLRQ